VVGCVRRGEGGEWHDGSTPSARNASVHSSQLEHGNNYGFISARECPTTSYEGGHPFFFPPYRTPHCTRCPRCPHCPHCPRPVPDPLAKSASF
jgi:hypothetical protein